MSYEKKLKELEKTVEKLSAEDITIEESLNLYAKGIELGKECLSFLQEFKGKIEILNNDFSQLETELEDESCDE